MLLSKLDVYRTLVSVLERQRRPGSESLGWTQAQTAGPSLLVGLGLILPGI